MPIRDVVADNQNGLLFPPLDREALVRNVRTLIDSPELRLRLGSRAREIVRTAIPGSGMPGKSSMRCNRSPMPPAMGIQLVNEILTDFRTSPAGAGKGPGAR